jgi:hypothetical protein
LCSTQTKLIVIETTTVLASELPLVIAPIAGLSRSPYRARGDKPVA